MLTTWGRKRWSVVISNCWRLQALERSLTSWTSRRQLRECKVSGQETRKQTASRLLISIFPVANRPKAVSIGRKTKITRLMQVKTGRSRWAWVQRECWVLVLSIFHLGVKDWLTQASTISLNSKIKESSRMLKKWIRIILKVWTLSLKLEKREILLLMKVESLDNQVLWWGKC